MFHVSNFFLLHKLQQGLETNDQQDVDDVPTRDKFHTLHPQLYEFDTHKYDLWKNANLKQCKLQFPIFRHQSKAVGTNVKDGVKPELNFHESA